MIVERSERGALTTNAYTNTVETFFSSTFSTPGQWNILDNTTIYSYLSGGQSSNNKCSLDHIVFNGYSGLDYKLEYSVVVREYNSTQILFESGWVPNNEICYAYAQWGTNIRVRPTIEIYVRRNEFDSNDDRRFLVPSDMRPSYFKAYYTYQQQVESTTAIPQDWLTGTAGTYTTDFSTMTTVVPTVCDIDDNEFNAFIDIPNKIVAGINLCVLGVGSLLNLKYVTFMICFVLIVGLVAWLIH